MVVYPAPFGGGVSCLV